MTTVRHGGRWTARDRAEQPYRYLPFDVPAAATSIRVRLAYDHTAGVLDLGCLAVEGWRGWSGGARTEYVVLREEATPGYYPGELSPGTWHVVLGLHRVPDDGLDYEVLVDVTSGADGVTPCPPPPMAPPRGVRAQPRRLPAPRGLRWLAGDLHAHTVHSDGTLSVPELAEVAAAQGLDFLAVTDHNTTSHHAELADAGAHAGIQLLPGQEVTTGHGHANAFGDIGWIDFREPAAEWWPAVQSRGGLLSVNHPLGGDCSWRHDIGDERPPLAEIWHSSWLDRRWGGPLAWWQAWDITVVPIGGSDFHGAPDLPPGSPTTWVLCADDDVLGGLRAGHVSVSATPAGPLLLRVDDELVAIGADGALLTAPSGRRRAVRGERATFPAEPGPHWLEDGETQVLALSG